MNKVVVTGGAGFIGSHLTERLLERGISVRVLDIFDKNKTPNLLKARSFKHFEYIQADVSDFEAVNKFITSEFDTIFHYASLVGIKKYVESPQEVINVNVRGTQNILEIADKLEIKLLFSSTSEIYGKNPDVPWHENSQRVLGSTLHERWTYSSSKAVAEHLVLALHKFKGLDATIVRYFNVYGPRQNPIFVVSQNMKNAFLNKPLLQYGNGHQSRCFTYVDDAVEATLQLAFQNKTGVFNIGSSVETTVKELVHLVKAHFTDRVEIQILDVEKLYGDRYEDIDRRIPDVSKIYEAIGWEAKTSLEEGLEKTKLWIAQNKWWLED